MKKSEVKLDDNTNINSFIIASYFFNRLIGQILKRFINIFFKTAEVLIKKGLGSWQRYDMHYETNFSIYSP